MELIVPGCSARRQKPGRRLALLAAGSLLLFFLALSAVTMVVLRRGASLEKELWELDRIFREVPQNLDFARPPD